MPITAFYASLLAFLFVALSIRTIRARRRLRVAIGDNANQEMLRAMRVHANFAEYVPFALLLSGLMESAGSGPLILHAAGLCLMTGRLSHAFGVSQVRENFRFRVTGMMLTFAAILLPAGYLLIHSLQTMLTAK